MGQNACILPHFKGVVLTRRHALQLRQAKLSFPSVQLIVGVCSDQLCADHKSAPAMTHAERCEAVRHCRWADEVVPDAPWVVDQAFMDKYQIDYLAHDELVYPSKDMEDVYAFAKKKGELLAIHKHLSEGVTESYVTYVRKKRNAEEMGASSSGSSGRIGTAPPDRFSRLNVYECAGHGLTIRRLPPHQTHTVHIHIRPARTYRPGIPRRLFRLETRKERAPRAGRC